MLEGFLLNLMKTAGITPDNIKEAYAWVMSLKGEVTAYKSAVVNMVREYRDRDKILNDKIDRLQEAVDRLSGQAGSLTIAPVKVNGEDHHVE